MGNMASGKVLIAGAFETEGPELSFIYDRIAEHGLQPVSVDVSTRGSSTGADIQPHDVALAHPDGADAVVSSDDMAIALKAWTARQTNLGGMIAVGGPESTALLAPALQSMSVGLPKLIVTTEAPGNVEPILGASDIVVVYSVTGLKGMNPIVEPVLSNAANAVAGAIIFGRTELPVELEHKPQIGLTMFGVTTPAIQRITETLESQYECLVFHATGTGGRSMEKLVDSGEIVCAIDLTTSEVCDMMMGGVLAADEDRFGAFIRTGVPYVGSAGGIDIVNWGPPDTVPERYRDRKIYEHNPQITITRTTVEENRDMGVWIGERLNQMTGPVRFLLPEGGFSVLDAPDMLFWDPAADEAFCAALRETFQPGPNKILKSLPYNINDPAFADAVVAAFREIAP